MLLYLASRSENISQLKKYYKKKIILIDRFVDSTIAYQHYGLGVNRNLINIVNKYLLKNFRINFTFLNIVNKKNMLVRLKERKILNRYDRFKFSFYNKVQNGYLKIYKKNQKNYQLINSNLDKEINKELVRKKVESLIK